MQKSATPWGYTISSNPSSTTTSWEVRCLPQSQASLTWGWRSMRSSTGNHTSRQLQLKPATGLSPSSEGTSAYVLPCSSSIKKQAYTTLVRSQLEYGAAIWYGIHTGRIRLTAWRKCRGGGYASLQGTTAERTVSWLWDWTSGFQLSKSDDHNHV